MTNEEVALAWAKQSKPKGRSPNNSLSFEGTELFSYAKLIGKLFPEQKVFLIRTQQGQSHTTCRHIQKAVRLLCSDNAPRWMIVADPSGDHEANFRKCVIDRDAAVLGIKKCRLPHIYNFHRDCMVDAGRDAADYARMFGIDLPEDLCDMQGFLISQLDEKKLTQLVTWALAA